MAYREVSVIEVREVLRGWLAGAGLRTVAAQAGVDRKTARRYVLAAEAAGVVRDGGAGQLSDAVIGVVVAAVRPARPAGHGSAWRELADRREQIAVWVGQGLTVVKIGVLLGRQGWWCRIGRCTGSVCSAAVSALRRRRCGWLTVSRGWSVRSISVSWGCLLMRCRGGGAGCMR
jgi:hypothetical protein